MKIISIYNNVCPILSRNNARNTVYESSTSRIAKIAPSRNGKMISFGVVKYPKIPKQLLEKLIAEGKKQDEICNELAIPKHYLVKLLHLYNLSMCRNILKITENYKSLIDLKNTGHTYAEISDVVGKTVQEIRQIFRDYDKLTMTYSEYCKKYPYYKSIKNK